MNIGTNKEQSFIDFSQIESKEILPGYFGKTIQGEHMTIIYWDIKAGSTFPQHNHPTEQISNFIAGEFELTVDGVTKIMDPGSLAVIKANSLHSGKAITDCKIIDVLYPKRESC